MLYFLLYLHNNHIANLVGVKNDYRLIIPVSNNTCLFTEDEISAVTGPKKGGNQAKSIAAPTPSVSFG